MNPVAKRPKPYLIFHGGKIRWRFTSIQSKQLNLKSIPGIAILNPLAEFDNSAKISALGSGHLQFKDSTYIQTEGLILKNKSGKSFDSDDLLNQISSLLRVLKVTSLQFDLDHVDFRTYAEIDSLKKHSGIKASWSSAKIFQIKSGRLRKDIVETSCTWNDLIKSDKVLSQGKPFPIYDEILLDARTAFIASDFRKAILYCAIACESFISAVLNEKYEQLKAKDKLRFSMLVKPGEVVDPIYSILSKSDNFSIKIHQTCLYLLNRSLVIDNKELYDNLKKMYNTRNKIAHVGDATAKDIDCLTIDLKGARKAFDSTLEFFTWLGNPRDRASPKLQFVD